MDEVDSIGSARTDSGGGGGDSEVQRTMLELLNQLDGFEATNKIKVGVCSPRPWVSEMLSNLHERKRGAMKGSAGSLDSATFCE